MTIARTHLVRTLLALASVTVTAALVGCGGPPPPAHDGVDRQQVAAAASPLELTAVPRASLCVTEGRVDALDAHTLKVDIGGMRAVVAGDTSQSAELAFTYQGPSASTAPLANGEIRRQIGLKLRAKDTCNVVYVMWHIEPTPGIAVSVKYNPDASKHEECGAGGYINLKPLAGEKPAAIRPGTPHTLRADLDGEELSVLADGVLAWKGTLPAEGSTFDGPAGIRSDNGTFDFELRVPGGEHAPHTCPAH